MDPFEIELELAKTRREAYAQAVAKVSAGQLGEAWIGLDRRIEPNPMRGSDRRLVE